MSTQGYEYQKVRKVLMTQMVRCRDAGIRTKVELILLGLKLKNISLACQRLGVGRSSYHKWFRRLVKADFCIKALKEKSRRPKRSPRKIDGIIEGRIFYYRRKGFGPEMIREYLIREGRARLSVSTINHVINQRQKGFKKPKPAKLKKHRKRYELPVPGQRVQIDVKYSPMLVQGQTVYIYVAIDECTRWRFAKAYLALNEHWTADFLSELRSAFPFPVYAVQTDNGHEFTFSLFPGNAREHVMTTWCKQHAIAHRLIPPGVKELNGKVERSHRIDADYFYGRAPTSTLAKFNRALKAWIRAYNVSRPHGGLGFQTPLEKLKERLKSLPQERFEGELDALRKTFLTSVRLIEKSYVPDKTAA